MEKDADDHDEAVSARGEAGEKLHVAAGPDGSATLAFRALSPGEYDVYCSVTGHRDAGTVAKLIVEG